ncbi:MAG: hypothetical protein WAM85_21615 [Terracidiphilus sp.]
MGSIRFALPAYADGTTYYVDNLPNSNCSDSGPHTLSNPWCSFSPLNQIRTLLPGDTILLAKNATWNQELNLTGSGTPNQPIFLGAYGSGSNPKILRNQANSDICVLLTDASNWSISDLEVGRASVGILLHYTRLFNNGISISDIYAHDNKGIWSGYSTDYPVSHKVQDPSAASLNINLSSGILFNIAANLTFNSSEYVLKGVTVSSLRGANNVDSLAFDAETSTTDNQDGHNAFQDVVLNGLVLSNDDGHAATAYQKAGLGCSDSLRLLGMMNVTLLDSILYDEAACHTSTGTAAVILGRISGVIFVNNIIFGVPDSGSPDETGVDFEWSEDHVDMHANLFAENAGAGIEILNIHPGDHTTQIALHDNSFATNSLNVRPGAASIWEDNRGSGYATPTGSIQNNVYIEPNGTFFAGQSIASLASSDNLATSAVPSYAAEQFSHALGENPWQYMYQATDGTWTNIAGISLGDHNGAWEVSPSQYVSAFDLAPASCSDSCTSGGVARVWIAPASGTIDIRGQVLKSDTRGGSGVYAAINLVSGRNVIQLWPASGSRQLVAGADQVGYPTDVDNVSVFPGEMIRFEVQANGDNTYDAVSWTPSISYVPSVTEACAAPTSVKVLGRQLSITAPTTAPTFRRTCAN